MNKQTEALKMAYKAEETGNLQDLVDAVNMLVEVVEALEQPAQEPVAWMHRHDEEITEFNDFKSCDKCEPLYTHPAPSWKGLSNDRIREIGEQCELNNNGTLNWIEFARAIEQALKEKNGR